MPKHTLQRPLRLDPDLFPESELENCPANHILHRQQDHVRGHSLQLQLHWHQKAQQEQARRRSAASSRRLSRALRRHRRAAQGHHVGTQLQEVAGGQALQPLEDAAQRRNDEPVHVSRRV